jgi:hypothetical protein
MKRLQFFYFIDPQDLIEIEQYQKPVVYLADTADVLALQTGDDNVMRRLDDV